MWNTSKRLREVWIGHTGVRFVMYWNLNNETGIGWFEPDDREGEPYFMSLEGLVAGGWVRA